MNHLFNFIRTTEVIKQKQNNYLEKIKKYKVLAMLQNRNKVIIYEGLVTYILVGFIDAFVQQFSRDISLTKNDGKYYLLNERTKNSVLLRGISEQDIIYCIN